MNRAELAKLRAFRNATAGPGPEFHKGCCRVCQEFPDLALTLETNWTLLREFVDQLRHMANTAHQAYHTNEPTGWQECRRPFCADAARMVKRFYG